MHLAVNGQVACGAESGALTGPDDPDLVQCGDCKETGLYQAAERVWEYRNNNKHDWLHDLVQMSSHEPISGPLGDKSVLREGMTKRERAKALRATFTDAETTESLRRIVNMARDTCRSCGGSIEYNEHDDGCKGTDPEMWELTPEETRNDLRVMGYTDEKMDESLTILREHVDKCAIRAEARIILDMTDEEVDAEIRAMGGDPEAIGKRGAAMVHELLAKQKALEGTTITSVKPDSYLPRMVTGEPAGIEPPYQETYTRRVADPETSQAICDWPDCEELAITTRIGTSLCEDHDNAGPV